MRRALLLVDHGSVRGEANDLLASVARLVRERSGLYIVECESLEDARHAARRLDFEGGVFEIRPVTWYDPGVIAPRIPQV